jgi:hypothetical protein
MSQSTLHMRRNWLITLLLLSGISLVLITQAKAKPKHSLRLLLSKYGSYAKWIEAMAIHESGNYTNTLSTQANNIFSMGFPSVRKASNIGPIKLTKQGYQEPAEFSKYRNYDQAIKDLILWLDYNKFPTDIKDLNSFIYGLHSKGYFKQDPIAYLKAVESYG